MSLLPTNLAFLRIAKRAERQDDDVLHRTFVDFGAVFAAVTSVDHQLIFGRRGTGKTHLLTVLRQNRLNAGEVAIQIDMRTIGSAGGIYSDPGVPLAQRATRLLVDVLAAIHSELLDQAINADGVVDLGKAGAALDELFAAHTSVRVAGSTTIEESTSDEHNALGELGVSGGWAEKGPTFNASLKASEAGKQVNAAKRVTTGTESYRVNFGSVGVSMKKIVDTLPNARLWLLIDEWSEVPLELQPLLADLIRRAILPVKGATVKIAAIEQRSRLLIVDPAVGHIGIQAGADVTPAINLDDHMVFDNDEATAVEFFKSLVLKHVQAALSTEKMAAPADISALLSEGFTQANAFTEVVRACEGVPRDAIHILSHAAQRAKAESISVSHVRNAAQQWYQGSKDTAVSANEKAKELLQWIVDRVIKERRTKAFLLESGTKDELIDFLYDERVLHVLKKGISAKDAPGKRFNVYGIDYGCYVDLINTARAPQGVLDLGEASEDFTFDVPRTDFRSIRRCVLDLSDFYGHAP
ncbi:hypothetical protein EJO68_10260 [Variovorax atrisoli]|uniref:ORC-CDC6 family AAA ATPase n=1 Tax=Variovorax atrisoli TaxID=3394203 RepID=UPI000F7E1195|nr:hypothetical protein [Variovorax sp. 369]RTD94180.1 hypothetical protein EJO68_10260 [Variovorax sp. 369]